MNQSHILLTGFRPFAGRGINGAETVARYLHGETIGSRRVETRLINVVWNDTQRFCERTLSKTGAHLVLALGEAPRPWPTFETRGLPTTEGDDVLGNPAPGFPTASQALDSRLKFSEQWFEGMPDAPRRSEDAGGYLCNWMLWHGVTHSRAPMGFLHLPVQATIPHDEYLARFAPIVIRLLEKNVDL